MRQALVRRLLYFGLITGTVRLLWILLSGNGAGMTLAMGLLAVALVLFFRFFGAALGGGSGFGGNRRSGTVVLEDSLFNRLRQKYEALAQQKKTEKQYMAASRIYLNLLQDPYRATTTLEEGAQYAEAAVLYEKRLLQLPKAAECYTRAHLYPKAIELYQQLKDPEKVGDTYQLMGNQSKAAHWYEQVVTGYLENRQYVKAALLVRKKLVDPERAQQLLLTGWQCNEDAFNCLNNYFAAIAVPEQLQAALKTIARETTDGKKQDILLRALQYEFDKGDADTQQLSRQLAHRIIAARAGEFPEAVQAMRHFHKTDRMIPRDVQRFKAQKSLSR